MSRKVTIRLLVCCAVMLLCVPDVAMAQVNTSIEDLENRLESNDSDQRARAWLAQAHLLESKDIQAVKALIEDMDEGDAQSYTLALTNPAKLTPEQVMEVADFYGALGESHSGVRQKSALVRAQAYYQLFTRNPGDEPVQKLRATMLVNHLSKKINDLGISKEERELEQVQWSNALIGKPVKEEPKEEVEVTEDPGPEPKPEVKPEPKLEVNTEVDEPAEAQLPKIKLEFPESALSKIGNRQARERILELSSIKPKDLSVEDLTLMSANYYELHKDHSGKLKTTFAVRALAYAQELLKKDSGSGNVSILRARLMRDFLMKYLNEEGDAQAMVAALDKTLKPMPGQEPVVVKQPDETPVKTPPKDPVKTPVKQPGKVDLAKARQFTNSLKMQMKRVNPGKFRMGTSVTSPISRQDETPHEVILTRPYFIAATEVTQKQYEEIMGNNPSAVKGPNLPVTNVSWQEAVEFCRKLSQKEGRRYRLPTEAEWEYACRAGTETSYGIGGDVLPREGVAVSFQGQEALKAPMPVNSLAANNWGLIAMHGNVWEWCLDRYGVYPQGQVRNPRGPKDGPRHVVRGGSFKRDQTDARSARRAQALNTDKLDHVGFRVVCEVR